MNRQTDKAVRAGINNKNGYTIIIAVIIMAVLLIIGVAVLTSAANSLNSVNQRTSGRQAYYAAKSTINVIDDSMHGGELGKYVRDEAYGRFPDSAPQGSSATVENRTLQAASATLTGSDALEGMSIEDLKISYEGEMNYLTESGTDKKRMLLTVTVSFTARSGEETYKLNAEYKFEGTARSLSGGKQMWETQKWETTDISQ